MYGKKPSVYLQFYITPPTLKQCACQIAISKTTRGCCAYIFNTMTADDLVPGGPRTSAAIMLGEEKKICTVVFQFLSPTLSQ